MPHWAALVVTPGVALEIPPVSHYKLRHFNASRRHFLTGFTGSELDSRRHLARADDKVKVSGWFVKYNFILSLKRKLNKWDRFFVFLLVFFLLQMSDRSVWETLNTSRQRCFNANEIPTVEMIKVIRKYEEEFLGFFWNYWWIGGLVGCWNFTSWQHLRSYLDGYWLVYSAGIRIPDLSHVRLALY